MPEMISLEEARELVLSRVSALESETVPLLDAAGRVAAADLASDIDVSPFAHSAMDGFAVKSASLAGASADFPVELDVIFEVPAGVAYEGDAADGQCVRIMTGAPLPECFDAVVKYEIVGVVSGDGRTGSRVSFTSPAAVGDNIRAAGEEAKAGETIITAGEPIGTAGIGFIAGCGILEVPVYSRPKVAIISIGSELVEPSVKPAPAQIRNSNSYALAACARAAGCIPEILPIVADDEAELSTAVLAATEGHDFVITSGGASNGDFDFIKKIVEEQGDLLMTTVNMRPGKAQTFGIVNDTPVFGLPGNPAAAYMGFELIIRPALRKMQGYSCFEHPMVKARLTCDRKKKDPRRLFMRSTLTKGADGELEVTPAKNQSSGLFGVIQKTNCMAILPEGEVSAKAGDILDCVLLDVPEEVVL
ncbi:MAG: molybdopterin molybdotransferase MoeA [bacterium]|nr:molybdopterin molybdotransferase MoeA [bacterium]